MKLEGKVALVTGAGRNIGKAIALALAREGARVAVNGLSDQRALDEVVETIKGGGGDALPVLADVSDDAQVQRMVQAVASELGPVDVLVSNAGIRPHKPLSDVTTAEWRKVLAVNLDATFYLCRALVPGMVEKGEGSIIAVSGLAAFGVRHHAHAVAAAKSGLIGLIRSIASAYGEQGVRANTMVLGNMATDRYDQDAYADGVPGKYLGPSPETGSEAIPLRRRGAPEEAADVCVFLASADSSYMTGQTLHVSGGLYMA